MGFAAAGPLANELNKLAYSQQVFRQDPNVLVYLVRFLGGLVGITVAALAGWSQWARYGKSPIPKPGLASHDCLHLAPKWACLGW